MSDAEMLARTLHAAKEMEGECRHCHCHGDSCSLPEGGRCVWMNSFRTVCSGPACLMAEGREKNRRKWDSRRAMRNCRRKGRAA